MNKEEQNIANLVDFMRRSFVARLMYFWVQTMLFFEGVIYAIFTVMRGHRMKVAKKITENYKSRQ